MQSAYDRVVRTLIVSIGIGSMLFTLLGLPGIIEQHGFLNPAFSIAAIVIYAGLPPVMALFAFRAPIRVLRGLAGFHALASLTFLALWIPAMTDKTALEGEGLTWISNTIAVATSEAAIAVGFLGAWAYMIVISVVTGVVRFVTYGSPDPSQAVQDTIMSLLLSGFMLALIQLTIFAGREQDALAATAREGAAKNAAAAAVERQRTRYQASARDEVLSTLYTASHNTADSREVARRSATHILEQLNQPAATLPLVATIPLTELDVSLRTAAVAEGISYASSSTPEDAPLNVPLEVGDALTDAMIEAIRNSNRHANRRDSRPVQRSVRVSRLPRGIEIVVKDNGRGFNPRRVGVDRLGVRLNIVQRVNAQPGASASILSVPGRGTTVTLEWNEGTNEN